MAALAQRQLDAYNTGDIDAFCACYHPEVTGLRLNNNKAGKPGLENFRATYKALFEANPNLHCELKSRIVLGETVVDEEWVTGLAGHPEGIHAVAIYGFRDGLIDRIWFAF